jgi:hypothetical protein
MRQKDLRRRLPNARESPSATELAEDFLRSQEILRFLQIRAPPRFSGNPPRRCVAAALALDLTGE